MPILLRMLTEMVPEKADERRARLALETPERRLKRLHRELRVKFPEMDAEDRRRYILHGAPELKEDLFKRMERLGLPDPVEVICVYGEYAEPDIEDAGPAMEVVAQTMSLPPVVAEKTTAERGRKVRGLVALML